MYDDIKMAACEAVKISGPRNLSNEVAREKRAIEQQNQWLTNTLDETHNLITRLYQELDVILSPQPEDSEPQMNADCIGNSQLYYSLRDRTMTAALANDRIRTILNTIEL